MTKLWVVRAGSNGERESESIAQGKLLPGFLEVDNLTGWNRDKIFNHLQEVFPDASNNRIGNWATQLDQFVNRIEINDYVVMPRKFTDGMAIGVVTGDYQFDNQSGFKHSRTVKWEEILLPRNSFKQDLRGSFNAAKAIFQVQSDEASKRVQVVLADKGRSDPGPLLDKQGKAPTSSSVNETDDGNIEAENYENIEDIANQQITSLVKSEFKGHALANLVDEILRAEGYATKVSPPGPDGGVDILAAGGTIGLGADRICVQVKSGDSPANLDVVMHLIGAVKDTQAQTGLLVSIGGVNAPALSKLRDNFFDIRLWEMRQLQEALFRTYEKLSDETRAKLSLQQIWVPTPEDSA